MIRNQFLQEKRIESKGQKISAALYLLTGHLPATDPIRTELRTLAVRLINADAQQRAQIGSQINNLLQVGMFARIISEDNGRILEVEIKYFTDPLYQTDSAISALFPRDESDKGHLLTKKTENKDVSFIPKYSLGVSENVPDKTTDVIRENKTIRHEQILSFINEKKSTNIKDIAALFPAVSEKTIQRELGALVAEGKISKRGDKRWSVYMTIQK